MVRSTSNGRKNIPNNGFFFLWIFGSARTYTTWRDKVDLELNYPRIAETAAIANFVGIKPDGDNGAVKNLYAVPDDAIYK